MPGLTTNSGAAVEESVIEAFASTIRGDVIRPDDDTYDEARQVFNAMIDKRPGLIVQCAGVADVINSVNFTRSTDLLVAVRGVGHNVAGTSVCDGGILIDLSQMKGLHIDRCFRHQLLLPRPYLVLTKPLRLDIQCQRAASVKIGWKYLDD